MLIKLGNIFLNTDHIVSAEIIDLEKGPLLEVKTNQGTMNFYGDSATELIRCLNGECVHQISFE